MLPVSVLAAISPIVFLNASTIASNYGESAAIRFASGNAIVLAVIGLPAMGLLGDGAAAFTERELASSVVDGALGLLLLGYGAYLWRAHIQSTPHTSEAEQIDEASHHGVLAWGVLGMATNFTTLPLFLAVSQHIGVARVNLAVQLLLLAFAMAVVLTPAWLPAVMLRIAPDRARVSEKVRSKVAASTRIASIVACFFGGAVLVTHAMV